MGTVERRISLFREGHCYADWWNGRAQCSFGLVPVLQTSWAAGRGARTSCTSCVLIIYLRILHFFPRSRLGREGKNSDAQTGM
jgi:hypothetical protein